MYNGVGTISVTYIKRAEEFALDNRIKLPSMVNVSNDTIIAAVGEIVTFRIPYDAEHFLVAVCNIINRTIYSIRKKPMSALSA